MPDYFEVELNSVILDLYITTRFYDKKDNPLEIGTQLFNGFAKVKIRKNNEYKNDVHFHFSTFWQQFFFLTYRFGII